MFLGKGRRKYHPDLGCSLGDPGRHRWVRSIRLGGRRSAMLGVVRPWSGESVRINIETREGGNIHVIVAINPRFTRISGTAINIPLSLMQIDLTTIIVPAKLREHCRADGSTPSRCDRDNLFRRRSSLSRRCMLY